ncbi:MAG: hypothetical protein IKZ53_10935 [Selenomonadaceae bacterium]|nr:hypothetical protein [Selenomonadaceae bacterium]
MEKLIPDEKLVADFFVTGNEYMWDSLDLKYIPRTNLCNDNVGGVSLADSNQDLNQSYLSAKKFFEQAAPKSIKFVLIGLSPYIVSANDKEPPVVCAVEEKVLDDYLKLCVDNGAKPVCVVLPVNSAVKKIYNADVLKAFRDTINNVVRKYKATFIDLLDVEIAEKLFKDKAHLNSEGSAAVSVLLGEKLYLKGILSPQDLCAASNDFFNLFAKHFPLDPNFPNDDKPLMHHVFCKMACEDFNRLSKIMPKETCMDLMAHVFSELTYSYLANLADILPKDDYNELTNRIFKITVENIRRKDKIKVGFYFDFSTHWCGDDLYNAFAKDERFKLTVFILIDKGNEVNHEEILNDSKRFKAHGLNVFEVKRDSHDIPKQDILFRFHPYPQWVYPAFRLTNLKVKETLLTHLSYSLHVSNSSLSYPLHNVCWKMFYSSIVEMNVGKEKNKFDMPRGIYSGYPKQDIFFKPDTKFHFDWKTARPDAKKIIWAPHWSINGGAFYATFQWNYNFMYEFAKAHPEISWVVKPHSVLLMVATTREHGTIFPSIKALNEYFQKWNDLPNAQVYTGIYYQDIFATSDGMIQDCGSFIAEYQYVDKPMIYLTRRDNGGYNKLGEEILKASYTVDGKDLDGIAAMMQRVFIEGDDYKAAERKAVFDKYLNYPKTNGMLASEFIYKTIADELKEESK